MYSVELALNQPLIELKCLAPIKAAQSSSNLLLQKNTVVGLIQLSSHHYVSQFVNASAGCAI